MSVSVGTMQALVFVLGVAVVWLAIGVVAGVVMAKRGHDFRTWFGLGAIAGPLVIRLIADADADQPGETPAAVRHTEGVPGHGPVDVLIGVDGSSASFHAVVEVTRLLGPRVGRVAVAAVIDVEGSREYSPDRDRADAENDLAAAAEYLATLDITPSTRVLSGLPAPALDRLATEEGFDLLAIGPRGRGLSNRVLGSTAEQLVAASHRPLFIASVEA